jgi:hypothetical protein
MLALLLACLVAATPAEAKKITAARVCGASECRETTAHGLLMALPDSGDPTDPPKHPVGGWYRTTITIQTEGDGAHETFAVAAFPSARYVRTLDPGQPVAWMPMTSDAARAYRKMTFRLEPRPLSSLPGFRAGNGPAVAEPAPSGDAFPWALVGALAALGAGGIAFLMLRRRPATG